MIESTALCFSVVYLDLTMRYGETGNRPYAALACAAGALAGLVKVTTFDVFLVMAAIWFAWAAWRAWRIPSRCDGLSSLALRAACLSGVGLTPVPRWSGRADWPSAR